VTLTFITPVADTGKRILREIGTGDGKAMGSGAASSPEIAQTEKDPEIAGASSGRPLRSALATPPG
jgi:hypothetical protein